MDLASSSKVLFKCHGSMASCTTTFLDPKTNSQYIRGDLYEGHHLGSYTQDGKQLSMPRSNFLRLGPVMTAELAQQKYS
jgi:hypothetical protein